MSIKRDPEWADEPAFLREFEQADIAAELVGLSALAFVQSIFHAYLERAVRELGGKELLERLSQMKKGSWFQNYRELFRQCNIDWSDSGVDLDFLEQAVLTRNDFMHNVDLLSAYIFQGGKHLEKYPTSVFREEAWADLDRITVKESTLHATIDTVLALAKYIEKSTYR